MSDFWHADYERRLKLELKTVLDTASLNLFFVQPAFYAAIGCAHMIEQYSQLNKDVFVPANKSAVPSEYIPAIQDMLVAIASIDTRVLSIKGMEAASFLCAVVEYDCWAQCLPTKDGSYGLARLLLTWHLSMPSELKRLYEPALVTALNTWLQPLEPWASVPSDAVLCQSMFGHAWLHIREPFRDEGRALNRMPGNIITVERPPFKAGLVPWIDGDEIVLPDLVGGALGA